MQNTILAAMPAANTAQAVATNLDQSQKTEDSTDFARVLTDCSKENTVTADQNKAPKGKGEENESQQEDPMNTNMYGQQEQQLMLSMACPLGVFGAMVFNAEANADVVQPGTTEGASSDTVSLSAVQAVPSALQSFDRMQAQSINDPQLQAVELAETTHLNQVSAQTAGEGAAEASGQIQAQQGAIDISSNGIARQRNFADVEAQADHSLDPVSEQGDMESTAFIRTAAAHNADANDTGFQGYEDTALEAEGYRLMQEEAAGSDTFTIESRQIFDSVVKNPYKQTDNESVDANLAAEAVAAQKTTVNMADTANLQDRPIEQSVFEQVFDKVSEIEVGGKNQVTFALKPDSLGSIKIMVEGIGQEMSITIETDNQKVREALSGGLNQLASSLGVENIQESQIRVVFTERQDFVQDGLLSFGEGSDEGRRNVFAQEVTYEASQAVEENEPEQMQVFMRTSRFNQYA